MTQLVTFVFLRISDYHAFCLHDCVEAKCEKIVRIFSWNDRLFKQFVYFQIMF